MTKAATLAQMGNTNQTFRNRIINGAMMVDQRNGGASITASSGSTSFPVDRMRAYVETGSSGTFTAQQKSTDSSASNYEAGSAPSGFKNSLALTTTTADASIGAAEGYSFQHLIEGLNVSDLGWGTANALPVTLSFWVRSSLTGTFAGSIANGSFNRAYVFNYTISSANTWEYKTVTVVGDTSGTWLKTNGIGLIVYLSMGAGSNFNQTAGAWGSFGFSTSGAVNVIATSGATLYITGVQLEAGTTATPFEQRLYGTELALCQRYYEKLNGNYAAESAYGTGVNPRSYWSFKVSKRTTPTVTNSGSGAVGTVYAQSSEGAGAYGPLGGNSTFGSTSSADAEL